MTDLLTCGPETAATHLVLAHGAGAPMTSLWLEKMTGALVALGLCVTRFEFAYMAARREGERKPPPKAERLVPEYISVVERFARGTRPRQRLVIGGKSMGGRVASLTADDLYAKHLVSGLVCLSYPFHPPKKPGELRTAHLEHLATPAMIVQGERDPFGTQTEVGGYQLSPAIGLAWMTDGDHDLAPRASSGTTLSKNIESAARAIAEFCSRLPEA